jgi:hypothetical protein
LSKRALAGSFGNVVTFSVAILSGPAASIIPRMSLDV